jgi:HNH endonuclease
MLDGCVVWSGCLTKSGYGRLCRDNKVYRAHRVAYEEAKGPIPDGMMVRHLCHNRACVNVDHLEIGTAKQNTQDMILAGRDRLVGQKNYMAKLSQDNVLQIRASNASSQKLADQFGVSRSCISKIKRGESWRNIA